MTENMRWVIKNFRVSKSFGDTVKDEWLEDGRELGELINKLKLCHKKDKLELAYPIAVPSCNDRRPSVIKDFKHITSPIYLFIYEKQKELYDYVNQENVTKVIVPNEYITIQRMRLYMQKYMDDKTYWMIDDDLHYSLFLRDRIETPWYEGLWVMGEIVKERNLMSNWAVACMQHAPESYWYDGVSKKKLGERFGSFPAQVYLLNGKEMIEHEIYFGGDPTVNEDVEMGVLLRKRKMPPLVLLGVSFKFYSTSGGKQSIASTPQKVKQYFINNYEKFGEYLNLRYSKSGGVFLEFSLVNEPIEKDPKISAFLEIQDWYGLREYVLNKKSQKA